MKITYPKTYKQESTIIIPDNILKEFVESNWTKKNVDEKKKVIESLIIELKTQMGLQNHYSVISEIYDEKDTTIAEFGFINEEQTEYGIKVNEMMLCDGKTLGADFLNSVCHEMKHAEQKEIELGLILPHSREEYQKILENSASMKKSFKFKEHFWTPKNELLDGLRYIKFDRRKNSEDKNMLYYFQYTEREAYKFGHSIVYQLRDYAKRNNLKSDLYYIDVNIEENKFECRTKNVVKYYGKYLNPNCDSNFNYHKEMEKMMDLIMHTIDTNKKPYNVPDKIWKNVVDASQWSHFTCGIGIACKIKGPNFFDNKINQINDVDLISNSSILEDAKNLVMMEQLLQQLGEPPNDQQETSVNNKLSLETQLDNDEIEIE